MHRVVPSCLLVPACWDKSLLLHSGGLRKNSCVLRARKLLRLSLYVMLLASSTTIGSKTLLKEGWGCVFWLTAMFSEMKH